MWRRGLAGRTDQFRHCPRALPVLGSCQLLDVGAEILALGRHAGCGHDGGGRHGGRRPQARRRGHGWLLAQAPCVVSANCIALS